MPSGEKIFAEEGNVIYAFENIKLEARVKRGIGDMLRRAITGEFLFLIEFFTEEKIKIIKKHNKI